VVNGYLSAKSSIVANEYKNRIMNKEDIEYVKHTLEFALAKGTFTDQDTEHLYSAVCNSINLLEQLAPNEGKICTPSMEEILNEAQRRKAKHSVQYADYGLGTWTVANDLLEHRKNALLNDSSVRKVRIEYEM